MLSKTEEAITQSEKQYRSQIKKGYQIYNENFNPGTNMHEFFQKTGFGFN